MAKATHSQEILTGTSDSYTEEELNDPHPPFVVQRAMLGELKEGDDKSVGTASLESSNDETQSSKTQSPDHQGPAQMTENPSDQTDEGDSDAPSTVGSGRKTPPRQSAKAAPRKPRGRANVRTTGDEDDFD